MTVYKIGRKKLKERAYKILNSFLSFFVSASIMTGILVPICGYCNKTETINLTNLSKEEKAFVLEMKNGQGEVFYYRNGKDNQIYNILEDDFNKVKINVDSKCRNPILKVNTREPVKNMWTFALAAGDKKEYQFYVPETKHIK